MTSTATTTPPAPPTGQGSSRGRWGLVGSSPLTLIAKVLGLGLVTAIAIWMAFPLIEQQNWVYLAIVIGVTVVLYVVYLQPRNIPVKYLVPGTIFLIAFQLVPVVLTVATSFTNFGDGHRGSKDAAIAAIEGASVQQVEGSASYVLTIATVGDPDTGELVFLLSEPVAGTLQVGTIEGLEPLEGAEVSPTGKITAAEGFTILNAGQASARSAEISAFYVPTEAGGIKSQGLSRAFEGVVQQRYDPECDCITDANTGQQWFADDEVGFFVDAQGANLSQGWRVGVGLDNFTRALTDQTLRAVFFRILLWNFVFATAVVGGTFALGLAIAMALNNPRVKGLRFYRVLIVLPYAMPAFAMMLVWRDMFNQDFGLINDVTGLSVNWLGEPWTARFAVILIQLWLGYPYMFLVTTGALQSIPTDLVEAAGVDGAKPFYAFRTVTFPLLLVAVAPLLISSFAFNFNNYNAIAMTTNGGPFPPDSPQAGATDLLISYTYRLAFGGAGAQYGLASAISVFIFIIVAAISIIGFRRTAVLEEIN